MELPHTHHEPLPEGTHSTPVRVLATDGAESWGLLHEPPGPPARVLVALAHPRVGFSHHYLMPGLLRAGHAVFGHDLRTLHNDSDARPDRLLADVAAGLAVARPRFERLVLLGNSGGGSLFAAHKAAGGAGDGLIVLAAHPGEGHFLLGAIDPAVTDETDPSSRDPELDMFDPRNGYDPVARVGRYDAAWLARYRAAQRARVARIDELARAQIAVERAAREVGDWRRAIPHRLMVVYRTAANPATLDLALDPSDRDVGTIVGGRPELGNHHILGLGRVVSPRTWLTYWSGLSSTWGFLHAAPSVETPLLFISAAGDSDILPADADAMWAATRGADRTRHDLRGADHYLRPTSRHHGPPPRETALALITEWIDKRWPRIST